MFICYDITTDILDNLSYDKLKQILSINNEFYNLKKTMYYKIRILQNWRIPKCHINEKKCYKVSFLNLVKNKNKYVGKRLQFILKTQPGLNISFCGNKHYILWECILYNIKNNIMEICNKKICFDVFNRCNCNQSIEIMNYEDEVRGNSIIKFDRIHQFSLRVIL